MIYGSIHTHFEDSFDAVTDMHLAVRSFLSEYTVKAAATGHGVLTEYENLKDILSEAQLWADEAEKKLKELGVNTERIVPIDKYCLEVTGRAEDTGRYTVMEKDLSFKKDSDEMEHDVREYLMNRQIFGHLKEDDITAENAEVILRVIARIRSFHIVPGVELYFGEQAKHMVLIAKDEEGYRQLSRIISDSNALIIKDKPITTMENLENNVSGGHLVCTSACAGGIFGKEIATIRKKMENMDEKRKKLEKNGYLKAKQMEEEFITIPSAQLKELPKITKKMIADAKREAKQTGDNSVVERLEREQEAYSEKDSEVKAMAETYHSLTLEVDGQVIPVEEIIKKNRREGNAYEKLLEEFDDDFSEEAFYAAQAEDNEKLYKKLVSLFGADNFYFEIQNHGIPAEKIIYNEVVKLAVQMGMADRIIASNDIHLCVTGDDPVRLENEIIKRNIAQLGRYNNYEYSSIESNTEYKEPSADDREYYIKNDRQLKEALSAIIKPAGNRSAEEIIDRSVDNIYQVLSVCNVEPPRNIKHYPEFCSNEDEEFDRLVEEGAARMFPEGLPEEYRKRLDMEKEVIKKLGYAGYHLIVQDYLNYGRLLGLLTKEQVELAPLDLDGLKAYVADLEAEGKISGIGLGIGPGRGSAAGSLCCYFLGITNIDPIRYGLLFERFLNTERVSMPDIDADFKTDIRDKVYEYCKQKYGEDHISKITTKTYLALKGALRKAAQYYLAMEKESIEEESVYAAKKARINQTLDGIIKECDGYGDQSDKEILAALEEKHKGTDDIITDKLLSFTKLIVGMYTVTGQHAAGVIISKDPIKDIVPVMWSDKCKNYQIQCEMGRAEEYGLLKMDFLGLKNLDICTEIAQNPQIGPQIDKFQTKAGIDEVLGDERIYKEIYSAGYVQGVFQFESDGMKKLLMRFKPECFDDIVLLVAAYRPGPMAFLDEIINMKNWIRDGKQGKEPQHSISLKNDALDKILAPTYGCPIYQEQIMQIFQDMAGYSLGAADLVRRAMSKKKEDKLLYEKKAFIYGDAERNIPGCVEKQGMSVEEADNLFEQMMPFAKYGFNKSHAACYAQISVYTAYLKLYSPLDFFRVSMDAMQDIKSLAPYYREAAEHNITILPPDFESGNDFTVLDDHTIKRGFSSVLGMGGITGKLHKSECAETFLKENPDISLKDASTMAELGFFKTSWEAQDKETENLYEDYIGGNLQYLADFISQYGKALRDGKEISDRHEFDVKCREELPAKIHVKASDKTKRIRTREQLLGSFAALDYGRITRLKDSMNAYVRFPAKSFADLDTQKDGKLYKVPAMVVSVTDRVSKKGTKMQAVTLVDTKGSLINCVNYPSFRKPLMPGEFAYFDIPAGKDETGKDCFSYKGIIFNSTIPEKELAERIRKRNATEHSVSASGITVKDIRNGFPGQDGIKEDMSAAEQPETDYADL